MQEIHTLLNQSLQSLLQEWIGGPISYESKKTEKFYENQHAITCHIGLYNFEKKQAGVALLNIDEPTLLALWHKCYAWAKDTDFSIPEIGMELMNTVTGRAKDLLDQRGLGMTLSMPSIVHHTSPLKLSTIGRDDFAYYDYISSEIAFTWVLCFYDAKEFA
jgi:hypothetical protein